VIDRGEIIEAGVAVGVADGYVISAAIIFLIDGQDPFRGEAVNGGQYRRWHQATIGEWQKVEVIMNQVEFGGPLKHGGNVQTLPNFGIEALIFRVGTRADGCQPGLGERVSRSEKGHLKAALNQALSQQ